MYMIERENEITIRNEFTADIFFKKTFHHFAIHARFCETLQSSVISAFFSLDWTPLSFPK